MAIGRWKQNKRKRTRFIMRALSMSEAPQTEISKRVDSKPEAVSAINTREKIRSRWLSRQIAENARMQTGPKRQRKKLSIFNETEKSQILQNYHESITSTARTWWASQPVRERFGGNWKNFLGSVNNFVFEQLDYYNPNVIGRSGKTAELMLWIKGGVNLFCRRSYFDATRSKARDKAIKSGGEPITARSWIPSSTKRFLKKLGLDPEAVKEVGFWDVRAQIIKILRSPQTGLTQREKQVAELRLEDKSFIEIAKRVGLRAKSSIHPLEEKAAKKIKLQLAKL